MLVASDQVDQLMSIESCSMALLEKLGTFLFTAPPEAVAALMDIQLISSALFQESAFSAGHYGDQSVSTHSADWLLALIMSPNFRQHRFCKHLSHNDFVLKLVRKLYSFVQLQLNRLHRYQKLFHESLDPQHPENRDVSWIKGNTFLESTEWVRVPTLFTWLVNRCTAD